MDVLLKLADGLCTKRVRNDFALACMFGTISNIEQPSTNGDEGIVVFTAK